MSQTLTTLQVVKRDGRVVPFDRSRITRAVERCFSECGDLSHGGTLDVHTPSGVSTYATTRIKVWNEIEGYPDQISVERIQDLVEVALMDLGYPGPAKRYILYRSDHARLRDERPIPEDVKAAFAADEEFFPTPLQQFVFYDKYSRFSQDLGRRETWVETVDRTVGALHKLAGDRLDREIYEEIRDGILTMRVMPSMRLLAMAGPAFDRDHTTGYNCAYSAVDSLETFSEALIISTSGCGVGFSVESKFVNQLPGVVPQRDVPYPVHWIEDSAEGWADALLHGLEQWFSGEDIAFAYDMIRPRGAVLKTKGGRASGPEPLREMLSFVREKILSRQGKKLRPIDCHDMLCSIGNAAVSGGQRRTAMISLFDEDDHDMLTSKAAGFEVLNKQRWNANNSAVWENVATMDQAVFIERFLAMVKSGNGEPGIFSRESASILMPSRRDSNYEFGGNPCLEIFLRSRQFCNLSASVIRADDTIESLEQKVRLATIIGTIQSMATNFPHLRPEWKKNCEEERLLGVDITGQQDNPELLTSDNFLRLRAAAIETNQVFADKLGINRSASITCVKPSGNTSQLVDCASGLHARWAPYYVRNVRVSGASPLARVLRDAGAPMSPENGDDPEDPRTWVVSFPVKAPAGASTRNDRTAVEQCEWWLRNRTYWTEHNPSTTTTYKPNEVLDVMKWVWDHRDKISGMSFLPSFDAKLEQLPYIEIDQTEYERRVAEFPKIDFSKIYRYELDDRSTASTTGACEGAVCMINE